MLIIHLVQYAQVLNVNPTTITRFKCMGDVESVGMLKIIHVQVHIRTRQSDACDDQPIRCIGADVASSIICNQSTSAQESAPFPLTTTISMAELAVTVLSHLFHVLSTHLCSWPAHDDLSGIAPVLLRELTSPIQELNSFSTLEAIGFPLPAPPPPVPSPAPSPQDELRLLHTSFDLAFASLAGQVKELAAKVNSSGPPPKAAAAKKPSAQPTPTPCAQPPTASAPTPASCPAPPSFASVVKTPARPSLVMALCPSAPGADIPLAICRSPQEVVSHLNTELADAHHPVTLSAA